MFKRLFTISLVLLILSSLSIAQDRVILMNNGTTVDLQDDTNLKEAIRKSKYFERDGSMAKHSFNTDFTAAGLIDTLDYYNGDHTSRFGLNSQDVMLTWFVAPADLIVKAIGVQAATDDIEGESTVSVKLVKLNYSAEEMYTQAASFLGAYPSDGDGFANWGAFPEEATGEWQDVNAADGIDYSSPFGEDYDLWSEDGFGWPIIPQPFDADGRDYQWVEMSELGFEPEVKQGEIFGIALVHDGLVLNGERIGYWASDGPATGIYSWKYYEAGRNDVTGDGVADPGWWRREFMFDYAAIVELTSDRPPVVQGFDRLLTTVSTGARTVTADITDDNPSGGAAGVQSADIHWSVDGGATFTPAAMTLVSGNAEAGTWSGEIPGQQPGTVVTYKIVASDGGLTGESVTSTYSIFLVEHPGGTLVIYNGSTSASRIALLDGYWIPDTIDANGHDIWNFGEVGAELVDNYTTIIEIDNELGPNDDNGPAIAAWLAAGNKNYLRAGMETLGYLHGYADLTFAAGDYEYDVLGVLNSYNDVVNYAAAGDELFPSQLFFQSGTALGGPIADAAAGAELFFFPSDIYGDTRSNWFDVFDPRTDISAETFVLGENKNTGATDQAAGHNYTSSNNNKIAFMTFDPLAIEDTASGAWYGASDFSPLVQAGFWFGLNVVGVDDEIVVNNFDLAQNYPNPFNPTTKIAYSIASKSDVSLKVYNLLGQEVATLVNSVKNAGTHEVKFDASQLSSGVYFYTLSTGDFVSTKKMMLIK
jgi:hypothetical protein